jgi:hypothetical protein
MTQAILHSPDAARSQAPSAPLSRFGSSVHFMGMLALAELDQRAASMQSQPGAPESATSANARREAARALARVGALSASLDPLDKPEDEPASLLGKLQERRATQAPAAPATQKLAPFFLTLPT